MVGLVVLFHLGKGRIGQTSFWCHFNPSDPFYCNGSGTHAASVSSETSRQIRPTGELKNRPHPKQPCAVGQFFLLLSKDPLQHKTDNFKTGALKRVWAVHWHADKNSLGAIRFTALKSPKIDLDVSEAPK